ncbi:hypothetical protein BJX99DRAFT_239431 [Aspergillus californicus]
MYALRPSRRDMGNSGHEGFYGEFRGTGAIELILGSWRNHLPSNFGFSPSPILVSALTALIGAARIPDLDS